jgi:hypothetical protein
MVGLLPGEVVYQAKGLVVTAASTKQLLAMKLGAWRDAIDRADARLLLERLSAAGMDQLWERLSPLVSPPQLDEAWYAFQDLWESVHGTR